MEETKIIYHIDEEDTPYLIKIPTPPDKVTLCDFKNALNRPSYKFFFKSVDDDFGVVKEEIIDDEAHLPCHNGRVVSWLVSADPDGSAHSGSHHDGLNADISNGGLPRHIDDDGNETGTDSESVYSASQRGDRVGPLRSFNDYKQHAFRKNNGRLYGRHPPGSGQPTYESASSMLSSDLESSSFFDSEDDAESSRFSTATGTTYSSKYVSQQRKKQRRTRRMPVISRASSFSSITESTMSLNVITVTLDMNTVNFLGISIVGQPPYPGIQPPPSSLAGSGARELGASKQSFRLAMNNPC